MKSMVKDLQLMSKGLKALTKKVEAMAGKIAKAEKQAPKKAKPKPKRAAKRAPAKRKGVIATDAVLSFIRRSRKGITTAALKEKTGFNETKVRNVIFRLKKQGKIKAERKGLYTAC